MEFFLAAHPELSRMTRARRLRGVMSELLNLISWRYCLSDASTTDFMSASPFSNWPPIILSMFMNK